MFSSISNNIFHSFFFISYSVRGILNEQHYCVSIYGFIFYEIILRRFLINCARLIQCRSFKSFFQNNKFNMTDFMFNSAYSSVLNIACHFLTQLYYFYKLFIYFYIYNFIFTDKCYFILLF